MKVHGQIVVDAQGRRWRAFAPGWRAWEWLGFLARRIVVARLPGRILPSFGWSRSALLSLRLGPSVERTIVRGERVGPKIPR